MVNGNRRKANNVIRKLLDKLIGELPEECITSANSICTTVNREDRRRSYSSRSIAGLLKERNDVKKTKDGWMKCPNCQTQS